MAPPAISNEIPFIGPSMVAKGSAPIFPGESCQWIHVPDGSIDTDSNDGGVHTPPEAADYPPSLGVAVCEGCEDNAGQFYCDKCKQVLCHGCLSALPLHMKKSRSHPVVTLEEYKLFKQIVHPELTDEERKKQHEYDLSSLWISVDTKKDERLGLEVFPVLRRLVEMHKRDHHAPNGSPCYPQLVSFVGHTGSGKSTLIRLLIERPWDINKRCSGASAAAAAASSTATSGATRPPVSLPPVGCPQSTVPTSGDIHLYRSPSADGSSTAAAAEAWRPTLYADCEGFHGGSQPPLATRTTREFLAKIQESVAELAVGSVQWGKKVLKGLRNPLRLMLNFEGRREDAVVDLFPRLLYNFSDVVVHVVPYTSSRMLERDILKLIEWAQSSRQAAVNRVILPHLVVVLTFSKGELSDWDPDETTAKILDEQQPAIRENQDIARYRRLFHQTGCNTPIDTLRSVLERCYSSVKFIRMPDAVDQVRLSEQLQKLDSIIRDTVDKSVAKKTEARVLLPSDIQEKIFRMAFEHYSNTLQVPFDLLEDWISLCPPGDRFAAAFLNFLKAAERARPKNMSGSEFCAVVTPVMCSVIALDICRSSVKHHPGTLRDIYKGKSLDSTLIGKLDEGDNESTAATTAAATTTTTTYQSHVETAVNEFFDLVCRCEFVRTNSLGQKVRCVNVRRGHEGKNNCVHQDRSGNVMSPGLFESSFVDDLQRCWNDQIETSLLEMEQLILEHVGNKAVVLPGYHSTVDLALTWSAHEDNLRRLHAKLPDMDMGILDPEACSWCLLPCSSPPPGKLVGCGHQVCKNCLPLLAGDAATVEESRGSMYRVDGCDLHEERYNFATPQYIEVRSAWQLVVHR